MRTTIAALLMLIVLPAAAWAQPAASPPRKHTALWTVAGAGGGFALGMFLGLKVFDDDVESEQKVWATAIASAAAGGAIACMLSRRTRPVQRPAPATLTDAELRELASRVRLRTSP